jgi:hypothetical protein
MHAGVPVLVVGGRHLVTARAAAFAPAGVEFFCPGVGACPGVVDWAHDIAVRARRRAMSLSFIKVGLRIKICRLHEICPDAVRESASAKSACVAGRFGRNSDPKDGAEHTVRQDTTTAESGRRGAGVGLIGMARSDSGLMGVWTLLAGNQWHFGKIRWAGSHTAGVLTAARHVSGRERWDDLETRRGPRVAALVSVAGMDVNFPSAHGRGGSRRLVGCKRLRKGSRPAQREHEQTRN